MSTPRRDPDYEDLLAREVSRRAAEEDFLSARSPSPTSLVFGAAAWVYLGSVLFCLLAVAGCIAATS